MAATLSWQVRLASALVALGAVLGIGMVILGFALVRGDPGFLFAVLPIVFLFLTVAGVSIGTFSWALVVALRRATPGVRMRVTLLGCCLVASGLCVASGSLPAAMLLVLYGGTLTWLMMTSAAARDLGPWIAPRPRPRPWFTRGTSSGSESAAGAPPPWWQTWRAGLAQGMPFWELVLVAAALLAFGVGLLAVPLGFLAFPKVWPLSALIPLAAAVVWFVERRMKVRLAAR